MVALGPVRAPAIRACPSRIRPPPGMSDACRVAAVDCGTNSLRLLVADVDPDRAELTDVARRMEIVRLGQGVDKTGRLAPEALARTIAVLRDYAGVIAAFGRAGGAHGGDERHQGRG